MQRQLIQDLERYLQSLEDEEEKITALNAFRQILGRDADLVLMYSFVF